MADYAVVIPWRPGHPDRQRNMEYVRSWFEKNFNVRMGDGARYPLFMPDAGGDSFNRGASRNLGNRLAVRANARVVIFCDADTIPEKDTLEEAIYAASKDDRLHLPYTHFRALTQPGTRRALRGKPLEGLQVEEEHSYATGGILVMSPRAYNLAGGHPELTGWGFEDTIFRICCDALLGETVRHTGTINHLWHPKSWCFESPEWVANKAISDEYTSAEGDAEAIKELISRRGRNGTIQRNSA